VSRSKTSEGAHSYGLHLLDVVAEGEDVNAIAKFCVPWAVSLKQYDINSARQQLVSKSVQMSAKDVHRSWTITNTNRRCWDVL